MASVDVFKGLMKKYNVVIKEIKTGKTEAVIGKNLNEKQAEKRETTGLMRIDRENYFVDTEEINGVEE